MKRIHNLVLIVIVLLSGAMSYVEIRYGLQEIEIPGNTQMLWLFIFAALISTWASKDPKQKGFDAPFEFNALIYFIWPLSLPYYLCKTRGPEGFVLFLGFGALYYAPFFAGLLAYVFYT